MIVVRTTLEILVMFTLVGGSMALHADWKIIEPSSWRTVILGFLVVLAANGVGVLYTLTERYPLTWATWTLFTSYCVLFGCLYFARIHARLRRLA